MAHLRRYPGALVVLALGLSSSAVVASAATSRAPDPVRDFRCTSGARFTATFVRKGVELALPERHVTMSPKPSHLGDRYSSPDGVLIISDDFASLILVNDPRFQSCRLTAPAPGSDS